MSTPLPNGAQCIDCVHMARCKWLIGRVGTETQCDWTVSRFLRGPVQAATADTIADLLIGDIFDDETF